MSDPQTEQFIAELVKVIHRFRLEHDITLATAVGVLHILAFDLMRDAAETD